MRNFLPLATLGCFAIIMLALIVGGLILLGYGVVGIIEEQSSSATAPTIPKVVEAPPPAAPIPVPIERKETRTLRQARENFQTRSVKSTYAPNPNLPESVPEANIIEYDSNADKFTAYLSKERKGGRNQPAVVWAHEGFGGIDKNCWEQAKAFHNAGFVLMVPSFRGENRNGGRFEMFYGEVDDLLGAVDYVAKLPYVDRNRVYVAGYDQGGTLALLAATTGSTKVRAFFSIAGLPNTEGFLAKTNGAGYEAASPPFDAGRVDEGYLRSALPFAGAICQPTFYFGARVDDSLARQAEEMERRALARKAPFRKFIFMRANHFNLVGPVIDLIAAKIAADKNGIVAMIDFETDELKSLFPK